MWPKVIPMRPVIIFMVVDLPEPLRPRVPVPSSGRAENETSSTAAMPEKCFETRRSSNMVCASYVAIDLSGSQVYRKYLRNHEFNNGGRASPGILLHHSQGRADCSVAAQSPDSGIAAPDA